MLCLDNIADILQFVDMETLYETLRVSKEINIVAKSTKLFKEILIVKQCSKWISFSVVVNLGNLYLAKYFYNQKKWICNLENSFVNTFYYGHLDISKWIYSFGNIDIHIYDEYPFRLSCIENHLESAKWLYSLDKIPISCQQRSFRFCCEGGRLEVAKWLYSLGNIDIHTEDDFAFRICKLNKNNLFETWLYSLE